MRPPQRPAALQARFAGLHTFFVNKWYFDEAIDFLIVRPVAWLGRFARTTFERVVVDGLVGGATALVRLVLGGCASRADRLPALLRRAAAGGRHRARRLLPGLGMTVHLSILIFWPLLLALLGALAPRAVAPLFALVGALVPLGYAVIMLVDYDPGAGSSTSPTTRGSRTSGSATRSGSTG